jgi:preprotein translocase subunit SecG
MSGFMTGRSTANLLTRTTAILAALFFVTSIALAMLASRQRETHSLVDVPGAAPPTSLPATPAELPPAQAPASSAPAAPATPAAPAAPAEPTAPLAK